MQEVGVDTGAKHNEHGVGHRNAMKSLIIKAKHHYELAWAEWRPCWGPVSFLGQSNAGSKRESVQQGHTSSAFFCS